MGERLQEFRAVCEEYAQSSRHGSMGNRHVRARIKTAQRGLGMLADLDDDAARLQPEAPTLPAGQLQPWVWDASDPRGLNLGWQSL
jgi:hypothetical protein